MKQGECTWLERKRPIAKQLRSPFPRAYHESLVEDFDFLPILHSHPE